MNKYYKILLRQRHKIILGSVVLCILTMSCLVKSCRNVVRFLPPDSNISFHRLPKNKELFCQWLVAINRENENITWTKGRYLCSDHFAEDDFVPNIDVRRLKATAIPALYIKQEPVTYISQVQMQSPSGVTPVVPPSLDVCDFQPSTSISADNIPAIPIASAHRPIYRTQTESSSGSSPSRKKRRLRDHTYRIQTSLRSLFQGTEKIKMKYKKQTGKLYRSRAAVHKLKKKSYA
ncbi:THAP domain [Popillia japonica]|uniref:THAP domain n=1 Tax=Popillia japonica TaxID=7064 RepID=A0AAW1JG99_POPJA